MTLPSSYKTSADYIQDTVNFLKTYQWLYNYSNTNVLVNKILFNFPQDWATYFKSISNEQFSRLPLKFEDDCPDSLKKLFKEIERLTPSRKPVDSERELYLSYNLGLRRKKIHEVSSLAPVIDKIYKANNLDFIIDIGSGLGYLSHHLNKKYKHQVLGIECRADLVERALENQEKYFPKCKSFVKFVEHFIDKNSDITIKDLYEKHFGLLGEKSGLIVGLHACADLSITVLDLFEKMDFIKCLVIMPCCYHRIEYSRIEQEKEYFRNFPVSQIATKIFKLAEAEIFLRRPFLRLACQQTVAHFINMNEEDHERHSRSLMFRAILQEVADAENYEVKRKKRKSYKNNSSYSNDQHFETYLQNLKNSHQLVSKIDCVKEVDSSNVKFLQKMHEKWEENKGNCYLIEALTCLQAAIQSLCENLILLDRLECFRENGFPSEVIKVTEEELSPRCNAIVSVKHGVLYNK